MKAVYALILLPVLFLECSNEKNPSPGKHSSTLSDEIFRLVNKHRTANGLTELAPNSSCQREAALHSQNMADGTTAYGHDGFDARFDLIADETGANRMGENVATGQTTAEDVMNSWLSSPPHRGNIEGDFTHLGVGAVSDGEGQVYFTQIFIKVP